MVVVGQSQFHFIPYFQQLLTKDHPPPFFFFFNFSAQFRHGYSQGQDGDCHRIGEIEWDRCCNGHCVGGAGCECKLTPFFFF